MKEETAESEQKIIDQIHADLNKISLLKNEDARLMSVYALLEKAAELANDMSFFNEACSEVSWHTYKVDDKPTTTDFVVTTSIDDQDGAIVQDTDYLVDGEIIESVQNVIALQESQVRDVLISLGWKPPTKLILPR